jgi:TP901 family phage tail tape measure protein
LEAAVADEKLEVEVRANINGLDRDMAAASKAVKGLGDASDVAAKKADSHAKKMEDLKRASTDIGKTMLVAGAAIAAGVALSVVEFAKYDKAASNYRAVSGATRAEMERLKQTSMNLGEQFGFTAVEVTDAATALNKAGVSTADVLGGALSGALTLAATDTIDVADAAEVAAIAMTQFKLQGKDVPHIVDLLAAGAGNAVGDVKDLSWGLRQSGLVASQFGLSVDETVGTLSAFASAGLIGSDAGTSFKQMLLSLASPSGVAAKKMAELGLSAYDTNGQFIGIEKLAGELQRTMGGLSQESRNAALSIIFGQDAIRSSAVLYELGAKGVADWIDKVDQTGYASRIAAEKLNNLNGDWKKLTVSVQNGLIDMGGSSESFLRPLVQSVTGAVHAFRDLPEPVKGGILAMAGMTAAALLLGGAILTGVPKVVEFKEAWDKLSNSSNKHINTMSRIATAVGWVTAAYAAATIAAGLMADAKAATESKAVSAQITNGIAGASQDRGKVIPALDSNFRNITNPADNQGFTKVNDFTSALKRIYKPTIADSGNDFAGTLFGKDSGSQKARKAFSEVDRSLADLAGTGGTKDATAAFAEMQKKAADAGIGVEDLIKLVPSYRDAMVNLATQNGLTNLTEEEKAKVLAGTSQKMDAASASADAMAKAQETSKVETEKWSKALDDIGVSASGAIIGLQKFTDFLVSAGLLTLSSRDATAKFEEGIDGLKGKIDSIMATQAQFGGVLNKNATDFDLTTKAGRDANDVFAEMATLGMSSAKAMAANGESQESVQERLTQTYDQMVITARGFGMGKDEAEALTRSILHIPPGVDVKSWMEDQARIEAEKTKAAMDAINGKTVHTYIINHDTTFRDVIDKFFTDPKAPAPVGTGTVLAPEVKKAGGGSVNGRGPKGVDSVYGMLAPGEHVWTADEVDKAGGQEAMYAMRSAVRSGRAYALPGAAQAAPQSSQVTFAPVFHVASQDTGAVVQEVKGWLRLESKKAGLKLGG